MEIKELQDLSPEIRSSYDKAVKAFEKCNLAYAADLFLDIITREPGFVQGRNKLREMELSKGECSFLSRIYSKIDVNKHIKTAQLNFVRKKYQDAMLSTERALLVDVKNLTALKLLADIGKALDAEFIVTEAYELAYKFHPGNSEVIILLADWYRKLDRGQDELKLRNKLVQMFPDKIEYQSEMRAAAASAMIDKQKWDGTGDSSYRNMLKSEEEAEQLEQKERFIHDKDDAMVLIKKLENDLSNTAGNEEKIQLVKELARLYYRSRIYDKAIEYLEMLQKISTIFDIANDTILENSRLAIINENISECKKYLDGELSPEQREQVAKSLDDQESLKLQIKQYHAETRVKTYPHDLELRYYLANFYFENNKINEAIEQFQLSQRHPHFRQISLINLGKCFMGKKLYDIAIEQFMKVLDDNPEVIDDMKINCLYCLGETYELLNDKENALKCYKKIYSINARYKDVIEKIEKGYA